MTRPSNTARGFSLVELAIVLVIVALLTSGIMISLSTQQDLRQVADTQRQMNDIRESLLGFSAAYGRLPCPAKPDIPSGEANAGREDPTLVMGVLPWAVLGLTESDAWGRRFTYRVTASFCATPAPPSQASFNLSSAGNIKVTDGAVMIADNLPVVVVSHGRNGRGGYLPTGAKIAGAMGDEEENSDNNASFVSHPPTAQGGPAEYDDLVSWIPLAILINRMITVGKLP